MKERKAIWIYLILLSSASALVLVQTRCRHDDLVAATVAKVCYQSDIGPIFLRSCAISGCHDSQRGRGGYSFTDYNSVMKAITPFNAQKSKAYKAITGKGFVQLMPPSGALSENERILIRVWIDQGAENTTCTTSVTGGGSTPPVTVAQKVCYQSDVLPVLVSSCGITGCHDQTTHKEGYTITSYANVMSNLVVAGSPTTSRLYTAISGNPSSENFMPPKPYAALTTAVKDSIFNWIKNGALNDVCTSSCDTTGVVTYQKQISALISKNCISCHSGTNASKGILLDTYAGVKTYLDNGKLLAAVKGTSIQMPPSYSISTCELRQIILWKSNGATQN